MKHRARTGLWIKLILVLTLAVLSPMNNPSTVHADIKVSGPITSDTTWTTARAR